MSRNITDQERREIVSSHYNMIESALKTARTHMAGEAGGRCEVVNGMLEFIAHLAVQGQKTKWPDPAKLVQDARQDAALQQLLKRASKSTPIRAAAGNRAKGGKP
jgi:hypothetical protein